MGFYQRRSPDGSMWPALRSIDAVVERLRQSAASWAIVWLNVAGILFRPSVGPYAVALTWALCVFGFIFIHTIEIFLHREPPG